MAELKLLTAHWWPNCNRTAKLLGCAGMHACVRIDDVSTPVAGNFLFMYPPLGAGPGQEQKYEKNGRRGDVLKQMGVPLASFFIEKVQKDAV